MTQMNTMRLSIITAALLTFGIGAAHAAVTADEAKQLGDKLTPFGAIKAGNADGSIPAYSGGLTTPPAGFEKGADRYVDPFAAETPLYVIDQKNVGQYADQLTAGAKAMIEQFPSFHINVFKTHRTAAYPGWVVENTLKNATTAKLAGEIEGDAVVGADEGNQPFPGVPFPIPKNGAEVMWNYHMHYAPAVTHTFAGAWLVDTAGGVTPLPEPNEFFVHPWYDKSGEMRKKTYDALYGFSARLTSPPSSAGTVFLNYYLVDGSQKVWFYTPGQRRVRAAPEFAYDVPIASYGGVLLWDEVFGFVGRLDRFDFNLVGRKEMIIPYNVFGVTNTVPSKEFLGEKHLDPKSVRWEKHRVWVVDAKRKEGARHVYSRRTFYIDEDCWCMVASESYDNGGTLWRVGNIYNFPTYDVGGGVNNESWSFNDLLKGNYSVINAGRGDPGKFVRSYTSGEGLPMNLTPQSVASGSVR